MHRYFVFFSLCLRYMHALFESHNYTCTLLLRLHARIWVCRKKLSILGYWVSTGWLTGCVMDLNLVGCTQTRMCMSWLVQRFKSGNSAVTQAVNLHLNSPHTVLYRHVTCSHSPKQRQSIPSRSSQHTQLFPQFNLTCELNIDAVIPCPKWMCHPRGRLERLKELDVANMLDCKIWKQHPGFVMFY